MPSTQSLDNKLLMSSLDHLSSSVGVDEILNVRNFFHAFVGSVDQPQGLVMALPPFRSLSFLIDSERQPNLSGVEYD
jgi:hypothetical protein